MNLLPADLRRPLVRRTVVIVAVVLFASFVIYFFPALLVGQSSTMTLDQRLQDTNGARTSLAQVVSGVGLLGTLLFTARTFLLSRTGQITSRYESGIKQLGDDNITVRIGGIYALERVVKESDDNQQTIFDVLASFVRERTPKRTGELIRPTRPLPADVQAALAVLGRRERRTRIRPPDLHGTVLSGADLRRTLLRGVQLYDALLDRAQFVDATLDGAHLNGASLYEADLSNATLRDADLTGSDLRKARLYRTDFAGATLTGCRLDGCDLSAAHNLTENQRKAAFR